MSDKNKNANIPGASQTEDNITLRAGNITKKEKPSRNIKPAPVVHTSGGEDIHIPDSASDEFASDTVISRFIKTNATPFVSVSEAGEPENDARDIDRYSDRLSVKVPEKKPFTGYTAKLNVYSNTHAPDAGDGRMILGGEPSADAAEEKAAAEAEAALSEGFLAGAAGSDGEKTPGTDNTDDIYEDAPTRQLDSAKGTLLREIADTAEDGVRRNPDQLMMEGFDSLGKKKNEEKAREEAELQNELHKARQQRISSFKFWDRGQDEAQASTSDEKFGDTAAKKKALPAFLQKISDSFSGLDTSFTPVHSEEYADFNRRKEVFAGLMNARKGVLYRLFAIAVIGIVIFIIDIAASVSAASNANGFFTVLGGNYTLYITLNLAALAAAGALLLRDLKTGLFSILKIHPKTDSALLLLMLSALAQNICAYFTQLKPEENFHLMAPAVVLLCVPYLLSKLFYYDNIRHCFKSAAAKSDKSYLRRVSDERLVAELLRDRESAEQNVVYAGKTHFIDSFLARSANSAYAGMPSSRSVVITAAAALAIGVITGIIMKNAVYGISAAVLCLALSFPVSCLAQTGFGLSRENKKLSVKSSFVQSHYDARDFASIDNMIVRDTDIFSAKVTNCLTAQGVSEKQAKFCAAVLTSKFGGALNNALRDDVSAFEDRFPSAENLVYEEKLGLSAWVSGCKVLLGTHTLLVNHNVRLPDEKTVMAFLAEDEAPVYLALEGRFAAVLGVKYSCIKENAESLKELVKNGTTILLSCADANLAETRAEELLGLPECSVRNISLSSAEKLSASMQAVTDSESAGIVFTDSFESLCRCALAAVRLDRSKRTAKLVCETGAYVGVILAAALSFTGAFSSVYAVLPVIVQALWFGLCFAAPLLFSTSAAVKKKPARRFVKGVSAKPEEDGNEAGAAVSPEAPADGTYAPAVKDSASDKAAPGVTEEAEKPVGSTPRQTENTESAARPAVEDEPGVISESTYAALDAFAGGADDKKTAVHTQTAAVKDDMGEDPAETAEDIAGDEPDVLAETLGKAKKLAGRLLSRFTVVEERTEKEDEKVEGTHKTRRTETAGNPENPADKSAENKKNRPFTATIPVKKRGRVNELSPSEEYSRQLMEEERTRASFTPPSIPEAPHYDLSEREIVTEKNPLDEKFIPPEPTQSSFYNDEVFSRFEDDNIFAALREGGNKKIDL